MSRIARLIIYDSEKNEVLAKQMAMSMPDGIHERGSIKITIINLSDNPFLNGFVESEMKNFYKAGLNEDEEYGDYVLDYYGIRDWVESLPKRSTSMMILQNYTIIGL